jgi:hypothetical protein
MNVGQIVIPPTPITSPDSVVRAIHKPSPRSPKNDLLSLQELMRFDTTFMFSDFAKSFSCNKSDAVKSRCSSTLKSAAPEELTALVYEFTSASGQ